MEEQRTKMERMEELVRILDQAGRAYYQESREIMSNKDYDALYDELSALEKETGVILTKSPTKHPGYEVVSELPKEVHASPMLSLDKSKEVGVLQQFLGSQEGLLSWKMDGLTVVLTYEDGVLVKAVTRGNGIVGEVVTPNARQFINLPRQIPFKGTLILRGEAVISYPDFEALNETAAEEEARYKNPRNLCAGSVRQLNSQITAGRHVQFIAFRLVSAAGADAPDFKDSHEQEFLWLKQQGFAVVEYKRVTAASLPDAVASFAKTIESFPLPSDGLVLLMDGIAYGESLGSTAKFPRNAMAFKWQDETADTTLLDIEWSPSRTGLINPVAIFEPVELEGTTVSRASVHNVSVLRSLKLGRGDTIRVYKANMIIPQIAENLTGSDTAQPPAVCPVCGQPTRVVKNEDVSVLMCENPDCTIKKIKAFELFVSRNAMNIDGLSTSTVEKFIACGFIHDFADIYHLNRHADEITAMDGFGKKSYANIQASVEASRNVDPGALLFALGIPGVGVATGKLLAKAFSWNLAELRKASEEDLTAVEGIGPVMAKDIAAWFSNEKNTDALDRLLAEVHLVIPEQTAAQVFAGKTFVITGAVHHFANRDAVKAYIEERGGKVAGSVSKKTDYLINNDNLSQSSKNKKAAELSIPVITEEEFLRLEQS